MDVSKLFSSAKINDQPPPAELLNLPSIASAEDAYKALLDLRQFAQESPDRTAIWNRAAHVFDSIERWRNALSPAEDERVCGHCIRGAAISVLKEAQSRAHLLDAINNPLQGFDGAEAAQERMVESCRKGLAACMRVADLHLSNCRPG